MTKNGYRVLGCAVTLGLAFASSVLAQKTDAPVVIAQTPARGASAAGLTQISVTFSSEVKNVTEADLTVGGMPARRVTGSGAGPYIFTVDPPKSGVVQVVLGGTTIEGRAGRPFAGDHWTYLDPPTTVLSMPDDAGGAPGAIVQVPISAAPADGIFGIDMTLQYDPALLEAQDVTVAGIAATADFSVIRNLNTPGMIIISMFGSQDPLSGSGEIAHIQFHVIGAHGTSSPLTFTSARANEGHIPVSSDNGLFTVAVESALLSMPDTAQGGTGSTVQVPISVTPGDGILGIDMEVAYDSAVLVATNVTVSGIGTTAGFAVIPNLGTSGVVGITTYATAGPLVGSGVILLIEFQVVGSPGTTSALTFTSASIDEDRIPATFDHGFFTVTCAGVANGTPCDDGEPVCTPTDTCQGGVCVGAPLDCNDANPCTVDSCTPGVGCQQPPGNAGAVCRVSAGQCDVAETCTGTSSVCPANGFAPSGTSCIDGNACTQTDTCDGANTCVGSNPVVCNDSNSCTDDSCNTSNGNCVFTANDGNSCTDSNVCTSDTCSAGACVYAASGACSISGTVFYYRTDSGAGSEPSSKVVPNVGIDRTQDALADTTTNSSGTYSFSNVSGNVTVTTVNKFGSPRASDHNNAITATDAAQIARSVVELVVLSPNQRIAGDVTGNGTLSALDASEVARFSAELVNNLPVALATGSDWRFFRCDSYTFPGEPGCGSPSYSFTPVSQPEAGKNFHGLLYGDVTGNWQPAMMLSSAAPPETFLDNGDATATVPAAAIETVRSANTPPAELSLNGWTGSLRAGERRKLTIDLRYADGILGLDLSLKYDKSLISIVEVRSTGIGTGYGVAHADIGGTRRIAAFGVTPLAGSGSVLTITIEALKETGRQPPIQVGGVANEGAIPLRTAVRIREAVTAE